MSKTVRALTFSVMLPFAALATTSAIAEDDPSAGKGAAKLEYPALARRLFLNAINTPGPNRLILYSKAECELCELAVAMLDEVLAGSQWQYELVDITTDTALEERYGWSIPVLRCADSTTELNWPFTPSRIRKLLEAA